MLGLISLFRQSRDNIIFGLGSKGRPSCKAFGVGPREKRKRKKRSEVKSLAIEPEKWKEKV